MLDSLSTRVILIGGSSHSGKTTLAQCILARTLAEQRSARLISTDSLARHPGRPWRTHPADIPAHVREHYASLSVDELVADVLAHYERLWPHIEEIIAAHLSEPTSGLLIVEGSALWPDGVDALTQPGIGAVWLTVPDAVFRDRINRSSNFARLAVAEQALVNKFLARTLRYNERMMERVRALRLPYRNLSDYAHR